MTTTTVETSVMRYLRDQVLEGSEPPTIADDEDLISEGIIDSLGIFLLVEFIENEFGVTVEAEEVVLENLNSVRAIANLVRTKQRRPVPVQRES